MGSSICHIVNATWCLSDEYKACANASRYHGYVVFILNCMMEPSEALTPASGAQLSCSSMFLNSRPTETAASRLPSGCLDECSCSLQHCADEYLAAGIRGVKDEPGTSDPDRLITEQENSLRKNCSHGSATTPYRLFSNDLIR